MRRILAISLLAAACSSGQRSSSDPASADSQLAAQLAQTGVSCAPPPHGSRPGEPEPFPPPPFEKACVDHHARDACFVHADDMTLIGFCTSVGDGSLLCVPPTPPEFLDACAHAKADADCTVGAFKGKCEALYRGGPLACLPPLPAPPPPLDACAGKKADEDCSFTEDGKKISGECAQLGDRLICLPGPPPMVEVCDGAKPDDECSFSKGDVTIKGMCRAMAGGSLLVCVPQSPPPPPPFVDACDKKSAGDKCHVSADGKSFDGICHQLPNGPLVCLPPPPPPPQAALDACTGKSKDVSCSFNWNNQTINGACELMPDGKTLVCAPYCKR